MGNRKRELFRKVISGGAEAAKRIDRGIQQYQERQKKASERAAENLQAKAKKLDAQIGLEKKQAELAELKRKRRGRQMDFSGF